MRVPRRSDYLAVFQLQLKLVGDECDELGVCRLAFRVRHGIAEEALERFGDVAIEEREGVFVLLPEYEEEISQWINS